MVGSLKTKFALNKDRNNCSPYISKPPSNRNVALEPWFSIKSASSESKNKLY